MDGNVSLSKKLLFIFPIVYFFSPITIIPYYFFPLAGWLDNVLVLGGMSFYLKKMIAEYDPVTSSQNQKKQKNSKNDDIIDINDNDYEID